MVLMQLPSKVQVQEQMMTVIIDKGSYSFLASHPSKKAAAVAATATL